MYKYTYICIQKYINIYGIYEDTMIQRCINRHTSIIDHSQCEQHHMTYLRTSSIAGRG